MKWIPDHGFRRQYSLTDERGTILATLRFTSLWSTRAEGMAGGESWTFEPQGWWGKRISVREARSASEVAVIERKWYGRCQIRLATGEEMSWQRRGFWSTSWTLTDAAGQDVVTHRIRSRFYWQLRWEVHLRQGAKPGWLPLAGGYLLQLAEMNRVSTP